MINKNTIQQYLKQIKNCSKRLILSIMAVLVAIIIMSTLLIDEANKPNQQSQHQSQDKHQVQQQQKLYSEQLNDITSQLAKIEKTMAQKEQSSHNKPKTKQHIQKLRHDIQSTLTKIKQQNTHVSDQIKSGNNKLHNQLVKLNKSLSQLLAKNKHHKRLSAKQLPFTTKAIDNIQRSDVVTVQYNHHIIPLEEGDALANWRLKHADSAHQKAKFINSDDDYVLIDLNRVQTDS